MELMDGLSVQLFTADGGKIEILPCEYETRDFVTDEGPVTMNHFRSAVSVSPGTLFSIAIEIDGNKFRIYSAEGLKATTAIGHTQQEPGALEDVQAQFIPRLRGELKNGLPIRKRISDMMHWDLGSKGPTALTLEMPLYETNVDTPRNDGLVATYNASPGHIALFIARGSLIRPTDRERITYRNDPPESTKNVSMGPIRYEWFEEIRSENGNAFVLDLTNTEPAIFDAMKRTQAGTGETVGHDFSEHLNGSHISKPQGQSPENDQAPRRSARRMPSQDKIASALTPEEDAARERQSSRRSARSRRSVSRFAPDATAAYFEDGNKSEQGNREEDREYIDSPRLQPNRKRKLPSIFEASRNAGNECPHVDLTSDDDEGTPSPQISPKPEPDQSEDGTVLQDPSNNNLTTTQNVAERNENSPSRPAAPARREPAMPAFTSNIAQLTPVETSSTTTARESGPAASSSDSSHERALAEMELQLFRSQNRSEEIQRELNILKRFR